MFVNFWRHDMPVYVTYFTGSGRKFFLTILQHPELCLLTRLLNTSLKRYLNLIQPMLILMHTQCHEMSTFSGNRWVLTSWDPMSLRPLPLQFTNVPTFPSILKPCQDGSLTSILRSEIEDHKTVLLAFVTFFDWLSISLPLSLSLSPSFWLCLRRGRGSFPCSTRLCFAKPHLAIQQYDL